MGFQLELHSAVESAQGCQSTRKSNLWKQKGDVTVRKGATHRYNGRGDRQVPEDATGVFLGASGRV